ncbi:hypothetical protein CEXT_30191 [Caerostris extrusa]|uniref:Uncharacterized protein n=1 Tax=Caerostris extrusa TaxID=172846 RepID=A0AAV4WUH5_CAEEX|nr:hypothetical protein CEXT_30191 [Caerostris extrusa]
MKDYQTKDGAEDTRPKAKFRNLRSRDLESVCIHVSNNLFWKLKKKMNTEQKSSTWVVNEALALRMIMLIKMNHQWMQRVLLNVSNILRVVKGFKKQDLKTVAELGLSILASITILELKDLIINSTVYKEGAEFVKEILPTGVEERKHREELEKDERKQREEQRKQREEFEKDERKQRKNLKDSNWKRRGLIMN